MSSNDDVFGQPGEFFVVNRSFYEPVLSSWSSLDDNSAGCFAPSGPVVVETFAMWARLLTSIGLRWVARFQLAKVIRYQNDGLTL